MLVVFTLQPNPEIFEYLGQFSEYGVVTLDVDDKKNDNTCQIYSEQPAFWRAKLQELNLEYEEAPFANPDYLKQNEMDFEPFMVGQYFICHENHNHPTPHDTVRFNINAGTAFGTGRHATTQICMELLGELAVLPIQSVFDCGTGTGILGMVARHQWPKARIVIGDNDPIAIDNARTNFAQNHLPKPIYCVAKGFNHPLIIKNAPFDVVIANILYPVLHQLAPICRQYCQNFLLLSGLLSQQADLITRRYRANGFETIHRIDSGDWAGLLLARV